MKEETEDSKLLSSGHVMGLFGLKDAPKSKTVSTSVIEFPMFLPDEGKKDLSGEEASLLRDEGNESCDRKCKPTSSPSQPKPRDTGFADFRFSIERDREIEITIEVIDFTPAGREGNGEWLGAYVQLGNAFTLDGKYIKLNEEEEDQAEREFLEAANR